MDTPRRDDEKSEEPLEEKDLTPSESAFLRLLRQQLKPIEERVDAAIKSVGSARTWRALAVGIGALALIFGLINTLLWVGQRHTNAHLRAESIHRSLAICAVANENRRAINHDKAALVKVFTVATAEQPATAQRPLSPAVLAAYADYQRPTQLIDCPKVANGQIKPLPLLPPGVDPQVSNKDSGGH